nr:hypothetical protein [Tanacetum cinerariifolium]
MTENRRLFTSYKAYDGGHVVFGSNLNGEVIGGGNIAHDSITITNVEHVGGLAFKLISVGQLCDNDSVVSFTKVDFDISKNGKLLAKRHRRCRLNSQNQIILSGALGMCQHVASAPHAKSVLRIYQFSSFLLPDTCGNFNKGLYMILEHLGTLQMRRLGHVNFKNMNKLVKGNLVRGLPSKRGVTRPPPEQDLMEEDQAGSDHGKSHVDLVVPNPKPMHDDFISTVYPKVHESLKHAMKEHVYVKNPLSSSETLSSIKNLDNFNVGD